MISVVVCTRDPEIPRDLSDSIKRQKEVSETLVVTDEGQSHARNVGLERAQNNLVAFVDDDAVLEDRWGQATLESFDQNPDTVGITGRVLPLFDDPSDSSYPESLWWIIGCTAPWDDSAYGRGTNMVFRKDRLNGAKFDEKVGFLKGGGIATRGDDVEFQMRVGKMVHSTTPIVFHKVRHDRCTAKYARTYAFTQGVAEARYRRSKSGAPKRSGRIGRIIFGKGWWLTRLEVLLWAGAGFLRGLYG